MGLSASLKSAIKVLFKALGDLVRPAVYHSLGGVAVWDEDAGKMVYPVTNYPIKQAAFTKFKQSESDKDPTLLTDMKMIFQRSELPVAPDPKDKVTDDQGVTWEIVKRLRDPIDGVIILQVRTT
jgi:hypothetical protein